MISALLTAVCRYVAQAARGSGRKKSHQAKFLLPQSKQKQQRHCRFAREQNGRCQPPSFGKTRLPSAGCRLLRQRCTQALAAEHCAAGKHWLQKSAPSPVSPPNVPFSQPGSPPRISFFILALPAGSSLPVRLYIASPAKITQQHKQQRRIRFLAEPRSPAPRAVHSRGTAAPGSSVHGREAVSTGDLHRLASKGSPLVGTLTLSRQQKLTGTAAFCRRRS